ncbi:MaoC/PaaZ C-terminal domain-containing protein [Haloplanus sp. GCM10025708]|uniref:MaoC/PaaZ C-terminal domain-containing protein n=1 Tax=Haloferacaceae TaxID=1644056 RepID=UPI0036107675
MTTSKRYYQDFAVGDAAESSVARTVSESDVYSMAGLTGSYNPLHTDKEYMKETEFERPIVQNTLLITLMEGLSKRIPEWDPDIVAAYGREGYRFVNPVFVDDTVHLEAEVVDKREKEGGRGIVSFKHDLYNQDDSLVATGEYLLLLEATPE